MAYSRDPKSRPQSPVPSKDDAPFRLPVLQAPELSSLYTLFDEDKYNNSIVLGLDQHRTITTQFLTTQFLSSMPRLDFPMQQSAPFASPYGQPFVPNFPFNTYYNR